MFLPPKTLDSEKFGSRAHAVVAVQVFPPPQVIGLRLKDLLGIKCVRGQVQRESGVKQHSRSGSLPVYVQYRVDQKKSHPPKTVHLKL